VHEAVNLNATTEENESFFIDLLTKKNQNYINWQI